MTTNEATISGLEEFLNEVISDNRRIRKTIEDQDQFYDNIVRKLKSSGKDIIRHNEVLKGDIASLEDSLLRSDFLGIKHNLDKALVDVKEALSHTLSISDWIKSLAPFLSTGSNVEYNSENCDLVRRFEEKRILYAYNMHDVKSIFQPISAIFEMLADYVKTFDTSIYTAESIIQLQEYRDKLDLIDEQHNRLQNFIGDSKELQPGNLQIVLDNILSLYADGEGLTVERHYAAEADIKLPGEIDRVFANIILNAAQAMDYKGILSVSTRSENGTVKILITDDGPGIDPSILSSFEYQQDTGEYRLNPITQLETTKEQGSGLGLAISAGIVHDLKGKMYVQTSDEMTTFTVELPIKKDVVEVGESRPIDTECNVKVLRKGVESPWDGQYFICMPFGCSRGGYAFSRAC